MSIMLFIHTHEYIPNCCYDKYQVTVADMTQIGIQDVAKHSGIIEVIGHQHIMHGGIWTESRKRCNWSAFQTLMDSILLYSIHTAYISTYEIMYVVSFI